MVRLYLFDRLVRVILLGIATTPLVAATQFLTLPFSNANVFLRQGWFYDSPSPLASCLDLPASLQNRCHKGIDYFLVEDGVVSSFDVLAAAPGKAVATYSKNGYGYFVLIIHDEVDEVGQRLFTLYAHIENRSWAVPFESLDRVRNDIELGEFGAWSCVGRGQKLARAGQTGGWPQIHLHFEVQRGGYPNNKTDPYDIYGARDA